MNAAGLKQGIGSAFRGALGRLGGLRVDVRGRTVLEVSILGLILIIGILFRIMPLKLGPYFSSEADTVFNYRVTEYVVKNGYSAWFSWHDTLSWYPMGRDIPHSSFPGLPFSAAFVYLTLQTLGINISLYNVSIFFPLLMASLTCIALYFLGKDLGGPSVGLIAAFFMAVSLPFITRTSLGFFDTENLGIFGITAASLFFLRSIEEEKPLRWRMIYAIAVGLSLAYLNASWGASRYAFGLLAIYVFASLLAGIYNRRYLISYAIAIGIGYLFAVMVPKLGVGFLQSIENVAVMGFAFFLLLLEAIRGRVKTGRFLLVIGVLFVVSLGGLLVLEYLGLIRPLAGKFLSVLDPSMRAFNPLIESVAEHKRSAWATFFNDFGLTLSLALFGSYIALRKMGAKRLYGMVFFVSALYFAGSMIRLFIILSIPVSLMAAYGLKELLAPFASAASQKTADRRLRRRRAVFGIGREMGIVFTAIILVAMLPSIWAAAEVGSGPVTMASTVGVTIGGSYPQDWLQALVWMRDNLPNNAIVVSWWDYGYWIETLANKTTLADGATISTIQIEQIAKIMINNQTDSLPILKKFGATHILVYNTFNPSNREQEWPFGDNAKWMWMVKIGGFNETLYYSEGKVTDLFSETTLYKLMNRLADSKHFKLAYSSENGWVLVYKIEY